MATRLATQTPIVARWQTAKARYQRSDSARRKIAVNCLKAKQNDDRRQEAERRVSGGLQGVTYLEEVSRFAKREPEAFQIVLDLVDGEVGPETARIVRGYQYWQQSLNRGLVPKTDLCQWPEEPFLTPFREAVISLKMGQFCAKFPALTRTLMYNLLDMYKSYLDQVKELQEVPDKSLDRATNSQESEESDRAPTESFEGQGEQIERDDENGEQEKNPLAFGQSLQVVVDASEMEMQDLIQNQSQEIVENLLDDWKQDWQPFMEKVEDAGKALQLDDKSQSDILDLGGDGMIDIKAGVWQSRGWKELKPLSLKLQSLPQLRKLVRELGRGGGMGPLRRAPRQEIRPGSPIGVAMSELSPPDTRGVRQAGDIGSMLSSEALLLLGENETLKMLFYSKLIERSLLSYDRSSWSEEEAKTLSGTEIRPAAEQGPIILCIDTSASMRGEREVLGKALVLEASRIAMRDKRGCIIYSFSGMDEVEEIELDVSRKSLISLLDFLGYSFNGGTNFNAPIEKSVTRLSEEEWQLADILIITDGEVPRPKNELILQLDRAKTDLEVRVHSIIVGENSSGEIENLSTNVYKFSDWILSS